MDLAAHIDHTLLKPTATPEEILKVAEEALEHGFFGLCIPPSYVPLVRERYPHAPFRLVTVVGFPLGYQAKEVKALEAALALAQGADEVDMVIHLGRASAGDYAYIEEEVRTVRQAAPKAVLKVILETGYFTPEAQGQPRRGYLENLAEAAIQGGADFLKTSTGFGPRGASLEDVELLVRVARGRAQVKAAGGIRNRETAIKLLEAGATRLGTSSGVALVKGEDGDGY
ncbi:2-deoxyribose-5-phosphate aldolase [Thermus scotoductus]|jgi:deoxyribose-phosphate aldolase|uniref:Deoxyribose-phosphate aldolase n=1 Tax=Thermus scotoductus TaxID=37636 RepID=A0A348XRH9_THESC|nr:MULTISPECIES: deoxyribose-phosphate aldolase [Thermus]RTG93835.1 2-deoxyribose-5-phosphate aldolase [Thermus scotoductus]RTH08763.1 2-deoxyribose-5-phosphate aldolase [Thermus scotoductus]RTH12511.1 2-deoxyribose-5-phosphate aldolase [Thermus scotoductus]RTH14296.1 2-deoxyribose-5-phosphate aldolase [Thermus scotoductus]RTH19687.1 2-deoxyribose-5-phosphate aldolase [Thermus scotoductus]